MDPLGVLMTCIAAYGIAGLFALGLAERFVPILPSYGVLVAIGIAAADGAWPVASAVAATMGGSVAGCLLLYGLTIALNEDRSHRLLTTVGRLAGMSSKRVDSVLVSFHGHQRLLVFGSQLVPTVRLISPVIAGLFRADMRSFTAATMAGIAVWNMLFIGVGHVAASIAPNANASILAVQVLVLLLATEVILALAWQWRRRKRSGTMRSRE
ncbi:DedA family protein [Plastoroseomonas hellenica]|uniref:DedA family protein n=1 Tax=Plastoroseomonas hellenica TaxID=2687306 RepID=UPI001BAC2AE0|nr:VTT domain-containing protein [Plastoroseomonas hellenica]MBR0641919.1 membrane-associated protein [Plastoroseomonas hellenica]